MQDVVIQPPEEKADLAFMLKMMHCFEKRQTNCTLPLLEALKVPWIIVSLPAENMTRTKNIRSIYKKQFYKIIKTKNWKIQEIAFNNEQVFCINKN